jgi:UDP-glucose 6-dehydrogenase
MKIFIFGLDNGGLSYAVFLAQHNEVVAIDIAPEKVALLNRKQSTIEDAEIEGYLHNKKLNLRATLDNQDALEGADYVIIATPANYQDVPQTLIGAIVDFSTACKEFIAQSILKKRSPPKGEGVGVSFKPSTVGIFA